MILIPSLLTYNYTEIFAAYAGSCLFHNFFYFSKLKRFCINIYQEDTIKDREAFENVGEGRFEMEIVLGEYRDTEDVTCKYWVMIYLSHFLHSVQFQGYLVFRGNQLRFTRILQNRYDWELFWRWVIRQTNFNFRQLGFLMHFLYSPILWVRCPDFCTFKIWIMTCFAAF